MKKLKFILSAVLLSFAAQYSVAQEIKTEIFKVGGNCGMCENRIENAAKKIDGVQSAEWDEATKQLKVSYTSPASLLSIQKAIAEAGHDTEGTKATSKAYDKLHGCCQYTREVTSQEAPKGKVQTVFFKVSGMTCADGCAKGIEKALYKHKGVKQSEVNFETGVAKVVFDQSKLSIDQMKKIIEDFSPEGESSKYRAEVVAN
ncbi:heavy-metal-associated domain-containing protein [Solitalea canadensis]|uniref:Copper chaperone n=1 Tax=Solitalea canadensis (strain ATCC 29591 / DSM 3403 / JCM 21819 / LMG 8368 / NBRC 15130 / NCIMB 12057 / USAM 9D) TaxID=929556 RepID=H8KRC4_SOLCM|nr:heavy metal-associated domain-containing protein [Solitalea canadensis]AFD07391.1 copper chaperone [Solitalea canadensis DSM 3403]